MTRAIDKLCEASVRDFANPYEELAWPETLDADAWWFAPEMVSIHGTGAWEALDEVGRRKLAFFEAVNFFSLNIHGERSLVEGLARRLYRRNDALHTRYLHHFLDEENKHMVYFGNFCTKYAGKIYPDRRMQAGEREYADGEEDLLFFARILIFEEIVDVYNRRMAKDERLHPLAREINRLHHRDETRHLAYGRQTVRELFEAHAPSWSPETLAGVRSYLAEFLDATWREYYNPDVYKDAGMPDPYELQRSALAAPEPRRHREETTRSWIGPLVAAGIVMDGPQ